MATALSGYDHFVRDEWRLPLFQAGWARLAAATSSTPTARPSWRSPDACCSG